MNNEQLLEKWPVLEDHDLETSDHWAHIIDAGLTLIHDYIDWNCHVQIKPKYGDLRFYCTFLYENMNKYELNAAAEVIVMMEYKAVRTCETCGAPGGIWSHQGWVSVACESCAEKLKEMNK